MIGKSDAIAEVFSRIGHKYDLMYRRGRFPLHRSAPLTAGEARVVSESSRTLAVSLPAASVESALQFFEHERAAAGCPRAPLSWPQLGGAPALVWTC